jgi:lipopolysaccharide/colanic/teichoic acid biosynthesis glycosyltransferase
MLYALQKRILDFSLALIGLIIIFPILLVIGIKIKIHSRGPVFFKQKRLGRHWKEFEIFKFRTMIQNAEIKGPKVTKEDDWRITGFGRFLRRYKLDELPQLINIIKGEMSFVGPRPEVLKYAKYFKNDYNEILMIRPGLTDYASLEFKNESDILKGEKDPEKVYLEKILPIKIEYYKKYLNKRNLLVDIKLIFKTIYSIFK